MAASSAATREAAAAVSWAWMRGYELSVAAQQEWPGPGPREGESDMETHLLVQELIPGARGAAEVRLGGRLMMMGPAACNASQQAVLHF
jgi:hypothetical protein